MNDNPFDNPTCKRCRERGMNRSSEDGEVYISCGGML